MTFLGPLLALTSAASFAFANVFISRTELSKGDRGVMFSVVVTIAMSTGLWIIVEGAALPAGMSMYGIGWFALAGVSAMVFGRSLLYASIRRLGVVRSSAVKRLNPFFAVILAGIVLHEAIETIDVIGMACIAAAFGLIIRDSFLQRGPLGIGHRPADYAIGVAAALAYAISYILRKLGLETLPSPALGTLISALAGFSVFLCWSVVSARVRSNLAGMFSHLDRWIVLAAVFVSIGQILMFAALGHAEVSTVVMIASLEIFLSMFLSVIVFRTERRLTSAVLIAATLAFVGVGLVAL
jgi:drug/metabolite transporter (DMT)-like permease